MGPNHIVGGVDVTDEALTTSASDVDPKKFSSGGQRSCGGQVGEATVIRQSSMSSAATTAMQKVVNL